MSMMADIMSTLNNVHAKNTGMPRMNGVTRLKTVAPSNTPMIGNETRKYFTTTPLVVDGSQIKPLAR